MTAQVFYEYIGHVFVPQLGKLNAIHVRALITFHIIKSTEALMLKLIFTRHASALRHVSS